MVVQSLPIKVPLCGGDRRDRPPLGRMIYARLYNSAAELGAAHVEHPAYRGRGPLHGARPRKNPGFPASTEPRALRPVHLKSGSPRFIGVGGRLAARAW